MMAWTYIGMAASDRYEASPADVAVLTITIPLKETQQHLN